MTWPGDLKPAPALWRASVPLLILLGTCLSSIEARAPFPADMKVQELDFPYGPKVRPYVNGILFGSAVTVVLVVTGVTLLVLCASCCLCCCVRRIPPSPDMAEAMKSKSARALDPRKSTFGMLYLLCLVLALLMLGCAVWATAADEKVDQGIDGGHHETQDFIGRIGSALCSTEREHLEQRDCDGASLFVFMNTTRNYGEFAFDHVLAAIIYVELVDTFLTAESAALGSIARQVDSVEDELLPSLDAATREISELLAWLGDDGRIGEDLSAVLPSMEDLPRFAGERGRRRAYVNCGTYAAGVRRTRLLLDTSIDPFEQAVDLVQPYKRDIDRDPHNSNNDIRGAVLDDVLLAVADRVVEANEGVLVVRDNIRDGDETLDDGQDAKTVSLQLYFFIPAAIQLVTLFLAYCRARPYPLGVSVFFTCCTLLVYFVIAFLVAVLAVVANDFCDYHEEFLITQTQSANFVVDDVTVDVSSSITPLLRCDPVRDTSTANFPWATETNNYVDIWGLQSLFDITEYTEELVEAIEEAADLLEIIDWRSLKEFGRFISTSDPTEGLLVDPRNFTKFEEDVRNLVVYVETRGLGSSVREQVSELSTATAAFGGAYRDLLYISAVTPHVRGNYSVSVDNAELATGAAGDELTGAVDDMHRLARLVADTRNYALCGYVGIFYEQGVEEAGCGDFREGLDLLWVPLVLIILLMDLSCINIVRGFIFARRHYTEEEFNELLREELGPAIASRLQAARRLQVAPGELKQ
eukprot:scaffold7376_cov250-Pinguiococcus_pyrenoidosus.AAC.2